MQATMRPGRMSRRDKLRIHRTPADFAILFALVMLSALAALAIGWQVWHTHRIYSGVTIAGVPVGGLTRAEAMNHVTESLWRYPLPSVNVTHNGRQWPITGDDLRVATDLPDAINRAYLVGRHGSVVARLNTQLAAAVGVENIAPRITLETSRLRYAIDQIATELRRPARARAQVGEIAIPAVPGLDVDVPATVAGLTRALENRVPGQPVVAPLVVIELAPVASTVTADSATGSETDSATGSPNSSSALWRPLVVRDPQSGLAFALDAATLQSISVAGDPKLVDETKLRALLTEWAAQLQVEPRNARLRFDLATQSPVVMQESRPGRRLDIEATLATVRGALLGEQNGADLVITTLQPAVDSNRVAEMGIRELVAAGDSYFAGSSAERVRNVQVAADKFIGVVIPPGGIFSFNEFVEDVSAANGFEDSLIIWGDRTAVGIGGGVCQVSTTIFRAAYFAGLPIVERYNHGYVVDWYGEPGLDATIFTPSVDFRFRNDTGAYLLMQPEMDAAGGALTINLYGTKPDRQVIVGAPVQSDITPAPAPLYSVDDTLAPGQRKQVDWAKQGMTVTVQRTIIEGGNTRTETLVSKYQPWRAVYLVGSADDIPVEARSAPAPAAPSVETTPDAAPEAATEAATETPAAGTIITTTP
jgi:vancomycin resistance protein YoaR